jgi:hypothetical protein
MCARAGLLTKCSEAIKHGKPFPSAATDKGSFRRMQLTLQEYDWLLMAMDRISLSGEFIQTPTVVSQTKRLIAIYWGLGDIKRIVADVDPDAMVES